MSQEWTIGARIDEVNQIEDQFKKQDPFNQSWENLKS